MKANVFKTCEDCRAAGRESKARLKFEKGEAYEAAVRASKTRAKIQDDEACIEDTKAKAMKSTGIKLMKISGHL